MDKTLIKISVMKFCRREIQEESPSVHKGESMAPTDNKQGKRKAKRFSKARCLESGEMNPFWLSREDTVRD